MFNTSPNNALADIPQGGDRPVFEADGSAFYVATDSGAGGAPILNASGFPTNANYNHALVKVVADPTTSPFSQNPNGWGLKVADYFIPYNVLSLDNADDDSGGPTLLPDSAGIVGHPQLMVFGDGQGKTFLLDRDNLGKFNAVNDNVLNAVPNGSGHNTPPVQITGSDSPPAFYNGKLYFVSAFSDVAKAFVINQNGTLSATSPTGATFGFLPGSSSVSGSGANNGIVWDIDRNLNLVRAYSSDSYMTELYDSAQAPGSRDALGNATKLQTPTVANGHVYIGTANSLVVYGLIALPPAPTVTSGAFTYETAPQRLTFTFDEDVHQGLSSASLNVQRLSPNAASIATSEPIWNASTDTATFNFTGILADGDYRATLPASGVANNSGVPLASNYVLNFFFLSGDANHDRTVDTLDFNVLAANFGGTNKTYSQADFNYDGVVDTLDFNTLAGQFGKTLPAPAMTPATLPAAAAAQANPLFSSQFIGDVPPRRLRTDSAATDNPVII